MDQDRAGRQGDAAKWLATQIERLVSLGLPERIGQSAAVFRQSLQPLQDQVPKTTGEADIESGTAEAVLVINTPELPARNMLSMVRRAGKVAVERLHPKQPEDFTPTADIELPAAEAYLLLGLDRGNSTLNVVPTEALRLLSNQGRSPLTIEEGIAVLLQWPMFLKPNHCFMMLGSRCGDRRVPALWLSDHQPKLGWCWEGNPHTWLGFASCLSRSPGVELVGTSGRAVRANALA
jgi:hypothetical protein